MTTPLHRRIRGEGPLLLIVQGGFGNAEHTEGLVEALIDDYTVVTYDRRGLSRSPSSSGPFTISDHADDAARLLAELTDEPAYVLGCSIGAVVGLDLAARHPDKLRHLLAHEPPALRVLPEARRAEAIRAHEDVEGAFRAHGPGAALPKLFALIGADLTPGQAPRKPDPHQVSDLMSFLANDFPGVRGHHLDLDALRRTASRITVGVGATSAGLTDHECARALAEHLRADPVEFPGGHGGAATHPAAFAATLRSVLVAAATT
ncbi:alpha/beta fold hydrolase [Allokutzneria albata]|uniref:Pimeloyl-ACP methyl ester carboxylesterase n=1 Tax=Allokutzneria albata TaxID=211114 RepID=A0A1G9SIS6_ALLAB|nr:alpha/beta fold hydrolase [Allokutzneria albata]SDM35210.1 Pimeloyl-ACP methyl ester carboxylesterase [Allokutzneria albata]